MTINASTNKVRFDSSSRHTGASRYPEAAGYEFLALDTGLRRYDDGINCLNWTVVGQARG